ncbi:PEGA domain-containing protein [Patescibacteria group bacterium]|nr:PEGA domain-containing protein [Patescibacteria group bacterium]
MRQNWWVLTGYAVAVLVFFVVATYVILFAIGYKFDWTTKTLKKTGFLLVETYPKNANLKIAGKKGGTTPITIKRLLPGDYLLEIDKTDYRSWIGTLSVESGLVTEKRNTLLTLKELAPELMFDKPVELLAITPDRNRAALVVGNEMLLMNIATKTTSNILAPTLILQQIKGTDGKDLSTAKITAMVFGPDSRMLWISAIGRRDTYHLSLNTDNGQMVLVAKGGLMRSEWLNSNQLTFAQAGILYLYQVGDKAPKIIKDKLIDYSIVDGTIYGVTDDEFGKHFLLKVGVDGSSKTEADNLPIAKTYQAAKVDSSWILITNSGGPSNIWVSERNAGKLKWNKFASNVTSKVWWDSNYLMYITGKDVMVADIKKEINEALKVATAGSWQTLYFSFDTLLFAENGKLNSLDITGKNQYQLLDLSSANQIEPIAPQLSQLLYVGRDKKLYTVRLREETTGLLNLSRFNSVG